MRSGRGALRPDAAAALLITRTLGTAWEINLPSPDRNCRSGATPRRRISDLARAPPGVGERRHDVAGAELVEQPGALQQPARLLQHAGEHQHAAALLQHAVQRL